MSISPFNTVSPYSGANAFRPRPDIGALPGQDPTGQASVGETLAGELPVGTPTPTALPILLDAGVQLGSPALSDPAQELRDYMNMSFAEKLQWSWMHAHGIDKAEFEAMSPEDKQKLLDQMREELKAKASPKLPEGEMHVAIDVYA